MVRFLFAGMLATTVIGCGNELASSTIHSEQDNDHDYRDHLVLSEIDEFTWNGDSHGSVHYDDIMRHASRQITDYGPTTNAHETAHMIHNYGRNQSSAYDQFLYVADGQGAYILEPQLHARRIRNYVPEDVKRIASSRYQLYIINQTNSWTNILYQFDEWNAYIVDMRVAVEVYEAGRWEGNTIALAEGAIDFLTFASAAALALKTEEPAYFTSNEQFKAVFARNVEETVQWYRRLAEIDELSGGHTDQLWNIFISSEQTAALRDMLREWYGAAWTERLLGF